MLGVSVSRGCFVEIRFTKEWAILFAGHRLGLGWALDRANFRRNLLVDLSKSQSERLGEDYRLGEFGNSRTCWVLEFSSESTSPMREPNQIRTDCGTKLAAVQVSDHFRAILGCILDENWTTPRLIELVITSDGHLVGRCDGEAEFKAFLGEVDDLVRNIHGVAPVAELDGDEVGYLVAKVAEIKRRR